MALNNANIFTSMPLIPYKIIMRLMDNDEFCKLIYYNTLDALDKPNLTEEQKRSMIWNGDINRTDEFNIFLTNVQPNEEIENKTIMKLYRYTTEPETIYMSTVSYKFDILFGSKIPLVTYNGVPCNRGDLIEMEIMKSLNNVDVAGIGCLQYSQELTALSSSRVGIGNNYSFTGNTIVMATQISDRRKCECI